MMNVPTPRAVASMSYLSETSDMSDLSDMFDLSSCNRLKHLRPLAPITDPIRLPTHQKINPQIVSLRIIRRRRRIIPPRVESRSTGTQIQNRPIQRGSQQSDRD